MANPTSVPNKGVGTVIPAAREVLVAGGVLAASVPAGGRLLTSVLDKQPLRAICQFCRGKKYLGGGKAGRGKCERCKGKGFTTVQRRLR